jgi:hypothetical protein
MSSVICQRFEDMVYVLDEIVLQTSSTPEVCAEFLKRYGGHRKGVWVVGDASGSHMQTAAGVSDYDAIRRFFAEHRELKGKLEIQRSNPFVRDRINLVNAFLKNAQGERRLFVDRKCRGVIQDFEEVSYKPNSGQIDKDRDGMRTHLSDALGYLVWHEFRPSRAIGERGERIL